MCQLHVKVNTFGRKIGILVRSLQLCPLVVSTRCGYNHAEANCILKV